MQTRTEKPQPPRIEDELTELLKQQLTLPLPQGEEETRTKILGAMTEELSRAIYG